MKASDPVFDEGKVVEELAIDIYSAKRCDVPYIKGRLNLLIPLIRADERRKCVEIARTLKQRKLDAYANTRTDTVALCRLSDSETCEELAAAIEKEEK